ncbi:hypothetical protein MNNICLKF_01241 [Synechococcus sp. CBW1107]|jgi:hypothetical protein|nr:hypothetical protein MNNICLKF_01241 [Synechococcus sp. CBW1107]
MPVGITFAAALLSVALRLARALLIAQRYESLPSSGLRH